MGPLMEKLDARYELLEEQPRTTDEVRTALARDTESGEIVVVRTLALRHVARWKAVELFEREVDALKSFDHPGVPRFVDSWVHESEDGLELGLVREWIEGTPLHTGEWEATPVLDETATLEVLRGVATILDYLHELRPPVIHRDIRPEHIVRRPDGSLALVGFGSIRAALPRTVGGSTFVGTSGYVAPEQLMGRAGTASDIFALGVSACALMTGLDPADMPAPQMRPDYEPHLEVTPTTRRLLDAMLAPVAEDRIRSGRGLVEALNNPSSENTLAISGALPLTITADQSTLSVRPLWDTDPGARRRTLMSAVILVFFTGSVIFYAVLGGKLKAIIVFTAFLAMLALVFGFSAYVILKPRRFELGPEALKVGRRVIPWSKIADAQRIEAPGHGYGIGLEIDGELAPLVMQLEHDEATFLAGEIRAFAQRQP